MDDDRMIIDGGVADPVPVDVLLKDGIQKIIAVNVLPGPADICKRNMLLRQIAKDEEDLGRIIAGKKAGDKLSIKVSRGGKNIDITVTLTEAPQNN